jgi:hypothetical protein
MRTFAFLLVVAAGPAYGQAPAPTSSTAAAAPAQTVEQTASPELVGRLVSELGITPMQAQGAAGSLFGVAKSRLSVDDFAKVAGAVPNMDGLLKAAPPTEKSPLDLLSGKTAAGAGSLGAVAGVAGSLSKLGLKPETIVKLAPTLVKAVESKGGAEVAALLAGALK